jgi:hypothetical protein
MYRHDHDAALLRIDALERENASLVRQVALLREMRPYRVLSTRIPPTPTPPAPTPTAPTPTVTFPSVRPRAERPAESDPSDWIAVALCVCFMILFVVINAS